MQKYTFFSWIALLLLVLMACGGQAATPTPDPTSVLQGYVDALAAKDIDAVMSYWAEDAVQIDLLDRNEGLEEIRINMRGAIADNVTFEVSNVTDTNGRLIYDYQVFVNGEPGTSATGFTIVKDGKIIFDGTEELLAAECERDASQSFCESN
jgi:hypothetical protein